MTEADLAELSVLAKRGGVVALGEIGLDYYYENSEREAQKYWFARQIRLAEALNLPYIVHDRDAHGDCLEIIERAGYFKGVFHCYSGSAEMAKRLLKWGFYISVTGNITFKNNVKTREVVRNIPRDRLLIETDCPYLTPEPHRGERNEPAYVKYVAAEVARLWETDAETAGKRTFENANTFFGIRPRKTRV
jgi:TatD DNase family protein